MQALARPRSTADSSVLGQRRGFPDLARFALDLSWARAEPESAAAAAAAAASSSGGYPSPPMSGSPPTPPKTAEEAGGRDDDRRAYPAPGQDAAAYRGGVAARTDPRLRVVGPPAPPPPPGPYSARPPPPPERNHHYAFPRPEEPMMLLQRPFAYAPPQPMLPPQSYLPAPGPGYGGLGPGPVMAGYPVAAQQPMGENPAAPGSPRRKSKGHVASACVPCKRAHLRCDAQRPCSRCLSNGKEDSCVDVQHKKRGRPRLREDRDPRFAPSGPGPAAAPPPDPSSMPMPQPFYAPPPPPPQGPAAAGPPAYDDPFRRAQPYRPLESQPPDALAPMFLDRGLAGDAGVYPPPPPLPLAISMRGPPAGAGPAPAPEPAAFLTMDLEVARASSTFADAIGRASAAGRPLAELVVASDRGKVAARRRQMQDEQARREPTYLPPIFGKQEEERVLRGLGFGPDEVGRYALDRRPEYLTFRTPDGRLRGPLPVRMGLAKRDSIYFVVVLLGLGGPGPGHPAPPSPPRDPRDRREAPYSYPAPPQPYSQPPPVSAPFVARARMGPDAAAAGAYGRRLSSGSAGQHPPAPSMAALSPGLPPSYAPSPSRPDYGAAPSYQIPRSELPMVSRPARQPPVYQLPPIRSHQQQQQPPPPPGPPGPPPGPPPGEQHDASPRAQAWPRERQRVDIGGLIDQPDASQRPR